MSLIQLRETGADNFELNISQDFVEEYFTDEFINNSLIIKKDFDVNIPEYLVFDLDENVDPTNFKINYHNVCFEIYINNNRIINIPLRFMINLKNYEICDNKIYITIPFQIFCYDIKISLIDEDIICKLTHIKDNISCKLISKGIYYSSSIRTNCIKNRIQFLASNELIYNDPINEFKIFLPFQGIHNGFFIETDNVDEINEIKLLLNGHCRIKWDRFLVKTKCIKINQNLLYFPINNKSYTNIIDNTNILIDNTNILKQNSELQSTLNLNRMTSAILFVKLDKPQPKICIYGLGLNLLKYNKSMVDLEYKYNNTHETINN